MAIDTVYENPDDLDSDDFLLDSSVEDFDPSQQDGFSADKQDIADIVARHGHSSSTAWLEFERYKIWRPAEPIPQSSFLPVQGYMQRNGFVFAWGNPLVSDPSALELTADAFMRWVTSQGKRPIWCCVDRAMEKVLSSPTFAWSTVNCIYEDIVDPDHVMVITDPHSEGLGSAVKDLKKNLRRAEKAHIVVEEVTGHIAPSERREVEEGIRSWKKSRSGIQIASTTFQPWLDESHRRYWLARHEGKIAGILVLCRIGQRSYQIKNCVAFPHAPKGTSEGLLYESVKTVHTEEHRGGGHDHHPMTFGITASEKVAPVSNLSGWKIALMSKVYSKVASAAGLLKRADYRNKFQSLHEPMYVCYPENGLGIHGIKTLVHLLRK